MSINDKFSIKVEINTEGKQQINQYTSAFDGLRKSISDLSKPIGDLNRSLADATSTISKLNEQNDAASSTISKVGGAFSNAINIFDIVKRAMYGLTAQSAALAGALTGGLSILLTFLPEIIEITKGLFKGSESVSVFARNFKDLNAVMKGASTGAAEQTAQLNVLYKAATGVNTAGYERIKYAKQLLETYPAQFKNMTAEDIANGKAKKNYQDLAKSILASAKAKAALNLITEQTTKLLAADYQIEKIKTANANEKKRYQSKLEPAIKSGFRAETGRRILKQEMDESDERARKAIEAQEKLKQTTQSSIDYLIKFAKNADEFNTKVGAIKSGKAENNGGDIIVTNNINTGRPKATKPPKEDKTIPSQPFLEEAKLADSGITKSMKDEKQKSFEIQQNQILNHKIERIRTLEVEETESALRRARAEDELTKSKIHSGDKFINAALKNSKKDSAIFKTAFIAKKATSIADTIINTKQAVMESLKAYAGIPFIGQALGIAQAVFMGAQGASSIAEIVKQKPGFAGGGRFVSDGKGALLSGYSRTDDTNAYLRSGEAVVVSEAMRNPWARNLVSAINVAHGGRDFSIANPGRGYAIGGIFTDGGNSNRYYSQPMNDQKDLANTIAYQMINNFPPVYVDVKDINTQQSVLAQTVNRVNL